MDFPVFGDAAAYDQLGRSCAAAIGGPGSTLDGCWHPLRPPGAALLMAVPHLVARDPVDAAYVAVAMNVAFLGALAWAIAATLGDDPALLPGARRRRSWIAAASFLAVLLNVTGHIPVRLADLPSLALFAGALPLAAGLRGGGGSWRYLACGVLAAAATLVKVSYLGYAVVLLACLLAVDPAAPAVRGRRAILFGVGLLPVLIQVANVYVHSGQLGVYDRQYMRTAFDYAGRERGIEAVFFTTPAPAAYLTQVAGDIGPITVAALRLYRGLFGFEWAVYHMEPTRPPVWTLSTAELVAAWALVIGYLAFSALVAWRAPFGLRLLNLAGAGYAFMTALLMHTEIRYYAFPRTVFWLAIVLLVAHAIHRRARSVAAATRAGSHIPM